MHIKISSEAKQFLVKKEKVTRLLIDIDQIDEGCTRIYNPKIELLENGKEPEEIKISIEMELEGYTFFISRRFSEIYGSISELIIDIGGLFEKVLIIDNIEAQTKNICKV